MNESYVLRESRQAITAYCTTLNFSPLAYGRIEFEWNELAHMWLGYRLADTTTTNSVAIVNREKLFSPLFMRTDCNTIVLHRRPPYITVTVEHTVHYAIFHDVLHFLCNATHHFR